MPASITEQDFDLVVDNTLTPRQLIEPIAEPVFTLFPNLQVIDALFPVGKGVDRYKARLIDLPVGTPDEAALAHIGQLEPAAAWIPAHPRHHAVFIREHGLRHWRNDSPRFYIVALGLYPTMFTNVDTDCVMDYLQFGPVIPGINDYAWMELPPPGRTHDYQRFYLALRKQ